MLNEDSIDFYNNLSNISSLPNQTLLVLNFLSHKSSHLIRLWILTSLLKIEASCDLLSLLAMLKFVNNNQGSIS